MAFVRDQTYSRIALSCGVILGPGCARPSEIIVFLSRPIPMRGVSGCRCISVQYDEVGCNHPLQVYSISQLYTRPTQESERNPPRFLRPAFSGLARYSAPLNQYRFPLSIIPISCTKSHRKRHHERPRTLGMSAMFNVSIGDRLKAAVNQLEATGTSLQARATANLNANAAAGGQASQQGQARQSTGTTSKQAGQNGQTDAGKSTANLTSTKSGAGADAGDAATAPEAVTSPKLSSPDPAAAGTSPRAAYSASAAHLADSALSGLTGLRKSFNFRGSQDGARPTAAQLAVGAGSGSNSKGAKELKDMQAASTSAGTSEKAPSRSASPAGFLSATSFGIGSDPSTAVQTPRQPRSPTPARGPSRLRSPAKLDISLPTPDPTDPSTYPLPPSPELGASTLSAPLTGYADPLGASPLAAPSDDAQTPVIALDEMSQGGAAEASPVIGLGLLDTDRELQAAEAAVEAIEHGETPVDVPASASDSGEAGKKLDAINKIIRELTPLEGGVDDPDAIEGWVRMMKGKVEMTNEELVRLRSQIARTSRLYNCVRSIADMKCKIPE